MSRFLFVGIVTRNAKFKLKRASLNLPESIDSAVKPEDEDVVHLSADSLVAVVEVGLFRQVLMQVELATILVVLPRGVAKPLAPNRESTNYK